MGGTGSTNLEAGKCVQNVGWKAGREEKSIGSYLGVDGRIILKCI
jgi:hypothetical protein